MDHIEFMVNAMHILAVWAPSGQIMLVEMSIMLKSYGLAIDLNALHLP